MQISLNRKLFSRLIFSFIVFIVSTHLRADEENALEVIQPLPQAAPAIVVRLRETVRSASRSDALSKLGVFRKPLAIGTRKGLSVSGKQSSVSKFSLIRFTSEQEAAAALATIRSNPEVLYAEPDYKVRLQLNSAGRLPNDFEFNRQTGLLNEGRNGTKAGADIHAAEAWRVATGGSNVVVAVVDTGIDYYHPDLAANIWTNGREIPGNGIDDDGNGFVDDVHGYDFVSEDGDPFDDNNHGSHVAGIIGAAGNNGIGIAGVCWNVRLMALKAFGPDGSANLSDVLEAIDYAVANGANIINASWGLDTRSRSLEEVVSDAQRAGILFVAAAGNDRSESPFYPAAYDGVVSTGATDAFDQRAVFSNFGTNVTVSAPGQDIYSTVPNAGYQSYSGTSMAAPHVSGLAALILGAHSGFSAGEVRDIIVNSADPIQTDHLLGRGRINAAAALKHHIPVPKLALSLPPTIYGRFSVTGSVTGIQFAGYSLSIAPGKDGTNFTVIAEGFDPVNSGMLAADFDSSKFSDGACVFKLEATNADGGRATLFAKSFIANTAITAPLSNDVLRYGETIEIRGRVPSGTQAFRIEYAPGLVPSVWSDAGIHLAAIEDQKSGLLAHWDTSQVASNEFFSLRLVTEPAAITGKVNYIYLDQHLKAGWPVRIPIRGELPIADWRHAAVADLDGDGSKEIILIDPGNDLEPARLLVYRASGDLFWSRDLAAGTPYSDIPTVGDLDNDGYPEIVVDVAGKLFVFNGAGDLLPGWPVGLAVGNLTKIVVDLRQDGHKQILGYSQDPITKFGVDWREMTVFDRNGTIIRTWDIPFCAATNDAPKLFPAVANLDADPEIEIIAQTGCSRISAYKLSSARNPVWTANVSGVIVASPVIGDIDHDGTNDILVATEPDANGLGGGLFRFDATGYPKRGWPVLNGEALRASPSLGDFDGDGKLEISIPSASGWALHLIQDDGFEADGWPVSLRDLSANTSTVIGDVDGDGFPDVIAAAPGYMGLAINNNEPKFIGGLCAWSFAGKPIALNGSSRYSSFPMEGSGTPAASKAAAVTLADVDGDGVLDVVATSIQERAYSVGGHGGFLKNRSGIYLWSLETKYCPDCLPWPQFQQNSAHWGSLPPVSVNPAVTPQRRQRLTAFENRTLEFTPLFSPPFYPKDLGQGIHGVVTTNSESRIVYKPAPDFHGTDSFNYLLSNGLTNETIQVSVMVKTRNHHPVPTNQTVILNKNSSAAIYFEGGDPDDDPLTYSISKPALHGEIWISPGVATYYPRNGYSGTDAFYYTASDAVSTSEPALVQITVVETNNPPQALDGALLVRAGKSADFTLRARDLDGDPLVFSIVSPPEHGTLNGGPEDFTYTPVSDYVGPDGLQFTVSDRLARSNAGKVSITITASNSVPVAYGQTIHAQPNRTTEINLSGNDPENERLSFRVTTDPTHGTLVKAEGRVSYFPTLGYEGPDRFSFSASDSELESEPAAINIYVSRSNNLPTAMPQNVVGITNLPIRVNLTVNDLDRDPIQCVILAGPEHGRIWGEGTNFTYLPNPDFGGNDSFTFKAWDGHSYGAASMVSISITPELPPSLPYFKSIQILSDGAVELTVLQETAQSIIIEYSADTYEWFRFSQTNPGSDIVRLVDTNRVDSSRFYRARSIP